MKKIILFLLLLLTLNIKSQTCLIRFDYMESYDWTGAGWSVASQGNYYTDAFVSTNVSAALPGLGSGTSAYETGFYILPNVTGLLPTYTHQLRFRLASYRFSNPTAATAGVDLQDYVEVQVSTNGGTTYTSELRITGNNNAYWSYNSTASFTKVVNGTMVTQGPAAGGDRTTTGDGYSFINITIPAGATQAAFRIFMRANAAGEEWWIDNIELQQIGACLVLPIELLSFTGQNNDYHNNLTWVTATETNNDYFTLERSTDGMNWSAVSTVNGNGTTSSLSHYEYNDYNYEKEVINYYRLSQTDFNGVKEYFNIIEVKPNSNKNTCKDYLYYDLMGHEVDIKNVPAGLYLKKCGDYTEKIIKTQ